MAMASIQIASALCLLAAAVVAQDRISSSQLHTKVVGADKVFKATVCGQEYTFDVYGLNMKEQNTKAVLNMNYRKSQTDPVYNARVTLKKDGTYKPLMTGTKVVELTSKDTTVCPTENSFTVTESGAIVTKVVELANA